MFIVGIDLGTTNCAVAYADSRKIRGERPTVKIFDVPQLTRPGHVDRFVLTVAGQDWPLCRAARPSSGPAARQC